MISRRSILLTTAILLNIWIAAPPPDKKTIIRLLTLVKEPVQISYELKGEPVKATQAVTPGDGIRTEQFEADADWLRDLTLKLTNTSEQTITHVVVNLRFPEVTPNFTSMALHQISLGVGPDGKVQGPAFKLAPNESIQVPLASRYPEIEKLLQTVGKKQPTDVCKVWVEFHEALFDDGTLFQAGSMFRRNPDLNSPQRWIRIEH